MRLTEAEVLSHKFFERRLENHFLSSDELHKRESHLKWLIGAQQWKVHCEIHFRSE